MPFLEGGKRVEVWAPGVGGQEGRDRAVVREHFRKRNEWIINPWERSRLR